MKHARLLSIALFVTTACCWWSCTDSGNTDEHSADTVALQPGTPTPPVVDSQRIVSEGQYCYITKAYGKDNKRFIEADYIRFLEGPEAVKEAKERGDALAVTDKKGDTTYSLPDGIYIVNEDKKVQQLQLADSAEILTLYFKDGQPRWENSGIDELGKKLEDGVFVLTLNRGQVTQIKQQFLP